MTLAAVAAAFLLGWAARGVGVHPTGTAVRTPSRTSDGKGDGRLAGVPTRPSDRSEQGARAAAIAFAAASQDWLYLNDEDLDRSVRALATAAAGSAVSDATVSQVRAARAALLNSTGRVWWLVRPLASKVESSDPTSARVVVWTVSVLSASEVALPQADWARVGLDLVWSDGSWRVSSITELAGPTPMTGTKDRPWQPEALDEALDGFERVGTDARR